MTNLASFLHTKLSAVAPVLGVMVGDAADRDTWRIDFADEATADQRAAAEALMSSVVYDPDNPPIDPLAYAANARWRKEIGGADWSGHRIDTDRESGQPKLLAEYVAIFTGQRVDPSPWKFANGEWLSLSNSEMGDVCLTAREHVAAAFAIEASITARVAAGELLTAADIDNAFA